MALNWVPVSFTNFALAILVLGVAYFSSLAIYRLYWSPLARFPGPMLAGMIQILFEWDYVVSTYTKFENSTSGHDLLTSNSIDHMVRLLL